VRDSSSQHSRWKSERMITLPIAPELFRFTEEKVRITRRIRSKLGVLFHQGSALTIIGIALTGVLATVTLAYPTSRSAAPTHHLAASKAASAPAAKAAATGSKQPHTTSPKTTASSVASPATLSMAPATLATPAAQATVAVAAQPSAPPTSVPQSPTAAPTASPASPTCGGSGPLGMSGSWKCTFDDEFTGTSLNTSKWVPQVTANSGYVTGAGSATACYVNSPNNVSVSGGYLRLTALKAAAPFTCSDPYGSFTTRYTAGMVSTYGLFDQTYGAFEVNAELPQSTVLGLQETFWLYPQNLTYGAWPASGEIDFAEFYSEYPELDVPYIHYNEATIDPDVTAYDCVINASTFNTYGLQWSPDSLTMYYNGNVCLVDHPTPASPESGNEPFNQPFFIALTQALGVNTNAFVPGVTQLPATTLVKFVRAWS